MDNVTRRPNKTLESCIIEAVYHGIASNKQAMAHSCHVTTDEVERALKRMKRKSWLVFDKTKKVWEITNQGFMALRVGAVAPAETRGRKG